MSALNTISPRLRKLERQLEHAASYAEWRELATEHDRLTGAAEWRASDDSDLLHVPLIRQLGGLGGGFATRCCRST